MKGVSGITPPPKKKGTIFPALFSCHPTWNMTDEQALKIDNTFCSFKHPAHFEFIRRAIPKRDKIFCSFSLLPYRIDVWKILIIGTLFSALFRNAISLAERSVEQQRKGLFFCSFHLLTKLKWCLGKEGLGNNFCSSWASAYAERVRGTTPKRDNIFCSFKLSASVKGVWVITSKRDTIFCSFQLSA